MEIVPIQFFNLDIVTVSLLYAENLHQIVKEDEEARD